MIDLGAFHFLRPGWLWLLPLAALIPWSWRRLRKPSGDWARICDAHLFNWLSVGQDAADRRGLGAWLAGLAIAIATLSLAGPAWVQLPGASFTARDARVIALDLSASMLAQDLKPDRLTQARFQLADLLARTTEGQMGVVAFGGDAFVVSPLTNDMNTIANLLPALRPDIIPAAGSRPDRALELAATLLERAGSASGEILLVSDSADSRTAARARDLAREGIRTSVLAVGTPEGAPIPSGGGFISDGSGNVVIARLDLDALSAVASAGEGRFSVLTAGALSERVWAQREGEAFERREDGVEERWQDMGPWLLLVLLPIVAAGFRRGTLFLFPLLVMPLLAPQNAHAGWWEDLWQTRDQQAWSALEEGDPHQAAALADDPAIAGQASYRAGDYGSASRSWQGMDTADARYNRGNALALEGRLDEAIAAYDAALALEPDMTDAIYNKNVIEQLKQEQESQQQSQGEQQGESEDSSEQGEETEQSAGEESESQQEGEEGEESESEQQQAEEQAQNAEQQALEEAWSEEDAQAMEQWLRRIPDDPGGLLRRKFRNEYLRRGERESEEEAW